MKFNDAIDAYISDMRIEGRINSDRSEQSYRACLERFAVVISNRDPRKVGRGDAKRYLQKFKHPNTQARQRSMLASFFDWQMESGEDYGIFRPDNPARQVRRPKRRKPQVYRMNLEEMRRFLLAASGPRERRVAFLGVCAGLRLNELRQLQGKHLTRRDGWIWLPQSIAKGGVEREVPVIPDLREVYEEMLANVAPDDFVVPAQQFADPPRNRVPVDRHDRPGDGKTIWRMVKRIAARAGIGGNVTPHTMRHAFATHVSRHAGVRWAQSLLGHADISTTQGYLDTPSLDELAASVEGMAFLLPAGGPANPLVETVGIEPTVPTNEAVEPNPGDVDGPEPDLALLLNWAAPRERVELYADRVAGGSQR